MEKERGREKLVRKKSEDDKKMDNEKGMNLKPRGGLG